MLCRITIYIMDKELVSGWKSFNADEFAAECVVYAKNKVMFTAEFKSE